MGQQLRTVVSLLKLAILLTRSHQNLPRLMIRKEQPEGSPVKNRKKRLYEELRDKEVIRVRLFQFENLL